MDKFYYLKLGLSAVLTFVGIKMVLVDVYKIPVAVSLGVIASILTVAVLGHRCGDHGHCPSRRLSLRRERRSRGSVEQHAPPAL